MAKVGAPGHLQLVKISNEQTTELELKKIIKEINEIHQRKGVASLEINRNGAKVVQYGRFRIAITEPPFSSSKEITIVRPIVRLSLIEYNANEKLILRLSGRAEGILISGPPGSGKSTLASSLAEFYTDKGKIVKTFESPRDLQVPKEVTQYGPLDGSFENAVDILLLVRPDYTIFDEIRKTRDFTVFSDMRLAGVGMIGVVHASSPLDSVQRFIGRVDLGIIPHILDTIIFVKDGMIEKVYDISLTVRVPTGMMEADLARPLVEVRDFNSGLIEYEIYTYGEENVVVPVAEAAKNQRSESSVKRLAESRIKDIIRRFDPDAQVNILTEDSVVVKVAKDAVPRVIGKGGSTVNELEKLLGIKINVEVKGSSLGKEMDFEIKEAGSSLYIVFSPNQIGKKANIYIGDDFVFNSQIGKKARIKIDKRSDNGKKILNAFLAGDKIKLFENLD
jgi:ATPase